MSAKLPLRDVHLPDPPSLWPPAPGWWLLAVVLLGLLAIPLWRHLRRQRRRKAWAAVFDAELAQPGSTDARARLVVLVALLRRAAREHAPGSEHLQGEAWLAWLDPAQQLDPQLRGLLRDGAYRPQVDAAAVQRLQGWARTRFTRLLQEQMP